jgi:hypothetical protein
MIAAHKTGRRARLCEVDPVLCDRILQRWETFAKDEAELIACGFSGRPANDEAVGEPAGDKHEASPGTTQKVPTAQGRQRREAAGHAVLSGDANPTSRLRFPHAPRVRRAGPFRG